MAFHLMPGGKLPTSPGAGPGGKPVFVSKREFEDCCCGMKPEDYPRKCVETYMSKELPFPEDGFEDEILVRRDCWEFVPENEEEPFFVEDPIWCHAWWVVYEPAEGEEEPHKNCRVVGDGHFELNDTYWAMFRHVVTGGYDSQNECLENCEEYNYWKEENHDPSCADPPEVEAHEEYAGPFETYSAALEWMQAHCGLLLWYALVEENESEDLCQLEIREIFCVYPPLFEGPFGEECLTQDAFQELQDGLEPNQRIEGPFESKSQAGKEYEDIKCFHYVSFDIQRAYEANNPDKMIKCNIEYIPMRLAKEWWTSERPYITDPEDPFDSYDDAVEYCEKWCHGFVEEI